MSTSVKERLIKIISLKLSKFRAFKEVYEFVGFCGSHAQFCAIKWWRFLFFWNSKCYPLIKVSAQEGV